MKRQEVIMRAMDFGGTFGGEPAFTYRFTVVNDEGEEIDRIR